MNKLSHQHQGTLYAIISGLCYGLIGYFGVTLMNSGLSVFNMLFWRFFVATLVVLLILVSQPKKKLNISNESLKVLFYGMAFYGTSTILYFIASQYVGTGLAMVIFFAHPAILMMLNSMLNKTKISGLYYFAFSILIIGMILLVDIQEFTFDILGIGLGLLSSLFYACYIFSSKKIILSPTISTLMVSAGCMITCLIAALMDSSFYVPSGINDWFNISCMALICTALPILLLLQALKYLSSEQTSMLSVLEPVFVVIFGIALLGETITNLQIMGAIIVLSGALMSLLPEKREQFK